MRRSIFAALALLAALWAFPARGEDAWSVTAGGGVGRYTDGLGAALRVGGTWNVRVERAMKRHFELGLAYVGGANEVNGYPDPGPVLQRDGGEVSAKALAFSGRVRPFLTAGVGVARYHTRQGDPGPEVRAATVLTFPLRIGVQAHVGALRMGLGAGWEPHVLGNPVQGSSGQLIDATLSLGARF